jgi:hypothetical protein
LLGFSILSTASYNIEIDGMSDLCKHIDERWYYVLTDRSFSGKQDLWRRFRCHYSCRNSPRGPWRRPGNSRSGRKRTGRLHSRPVSSESMHGDFFEQSSTIE